MYAEVSVTSIEGGDDDDDDVGDDNDDDDEADCDGVGEAMVYVSVASVRRLSGPDRVPYPKAERIPIVGVPIVRKDRSLFVATVRIIFDPNILIL